MAHFTHSLAALVAACGICACGELPGFRVNAKSDSFTQVAVKNDKIDMLFIVDNSGSMAGEQATLASSFSSFINHFLDRGLDYHIGVISTDVLQNPNWWQSKLTTKPYLNFPNAGPGTLLAYTGNDRYLTPASANLITQFQKNAQLGTKGDGAEAGLLSATLAMDPAVTGAGGWNEGFFRPDAYLAMVVISDEDESYGVGATSTIRTTYIRTNQADRDARVNGFATAFNGLKPGRPDMLRFDAIVAPSAADCPTLGSSGQDQGYGQVYIQVAGMFNGTVSNICHDFSPDIENLGANIVKMLTRFKLVQPPDGQIEVTVDGVIVPQDATNGWTFHADTNEIEFHGTAVPGVNAQVSVRYIPDKPI